MNRRLGFFYVSADILWDPNSETALHALFAGMIVVRAEQDWNVARIRYLALHEDFESIDRGAVPPEYRATYKDGRWHWKKVAA